MNTIPALQARSVAFLACRNAIWVLAAMPDCGRAANDRDRHMTDMSVCCAPLINLWGAYWPAWVLCLLCGILLTLVSRLIFSWTHLEQHVGPLLLVYPMLFVGYACGLWLLFYSG